MTVLLHVESNVDLPALFVLCALHRQIDLLSIFVMKLSSFSQDFTLLPYLKYHCEQVLTFTSFYFIVTAKSGVMTEDCFSLVEFVRKQCPNLQFAGLMTIGSFDHDLSQGPNPDFQVLVTISSALFCFVPPHNMMNGSLMLG